MYSDEIHDDDAKIDELWTFHPVAEQEEITEEHRTEDILARKRSRKILKTCKKKLLLKVKLSTYFPAEN